MNVDRHDYEMMLVNMIGLKKLAANPDAGAASGIGDLYVGADNKLHYKDPAGVDHTLPLTAADDTLVAHLAGVENITGIKTFTADVHMTGMLYEGIGAALVIAANTIAPTSLMHHCGAGLIKTITVPPGSIAGQSPTVTLWPDAAFTYDATGNILVPAGGGTAVINRVMTFTFDPGVAKWAPSY
jgi:hypothetical protein